MNQEESIYGFIANTKAGRLTGEDSDVFEKYIIGVETLINSQINNPRNRNRVRLQIINTNKMEPIKANINYNTVEKRIEIRVTYTANGIREILNEYGEALSLIEDNGVIYADTGNVSLARDYYYFTVIDNKENKKELSIIPSVDSLFKVAYISGTDNMNNTATYTKAQETKTTDEKNLINQLYDKLYEMDSDSEIIYNKAIKNEDQSITAIENQQRTSEDEQYYLWEVYNVDSNNVWKKERVNATALNKGTNIYYYYYCTQGNTIATLSTPITTNKVDTSGIGNFYTTWIDLSRPPILWQSTNARSYYQWTNRSATWTVDHYVYTWSGWHYYLETTYTKGAFRNYYVAYEDDYNDNEKNGSYWYERGNILRKYTLSKYDADLNLKSTYDVDTAILTTEGMDISNKGRNKVKLKLTTTGTDYKVYISEDKTNWEEVTEITSNTPKELEVDGWNKLYIKIETNFDFISNIDIAYYKD